MVVKTMLSFWTAQSLLLEMSDTEVILDLNNEARPVMLDRGFPPKQ